MLQLSRCPLTRTLRCAIYSRTQWRNALLDETPTHPLEQVGIEPPTCMRQVDYVATPVIPRSVVVVMCGTAFTGLVKTSAAICEVLT
jgi:hypothetical protein